MNISEWIDSKKGKEFIDKELFDSIIFSLREAPGKWEIYVEDPYLYLIFKVPKGIRVTIRTDKYGGNADLFLYYLTKRQQKILKHAVSLFPALLLARIENEESYKQDIIKLKENLRKK